MCCNHQRLVIAVMFMLDYLAQTIDKQAASETTNGVMTRVVIKMHMNITKIISY